MLWIACSLSRNQRNLNSTPRSIQRYRKLLSKSFTSPLWKYLFKNLHSPAPEPQPSKWPGSWVNCELLQNVTAWSKAWWGRQSTRCLLWIKSQQVEQVYVRVLWFMQQAATSSFFLNHPKRCEQTVLQHVGFNGSSSCLEWVRNGLGLAKDNR